MSLRTRNGIVAEYKKPLEFVEDQNAVFWTHTEIKMEKDIQDILVNLTEAERHGVLTVLKLFTLYEVFAGEEYWGGRFARTYPRIEMQEMASCFSFFENCVHRRFYQSINEHLRIHTREFYESFEESPALKERMDFLDQYVNGPDDLLSVAVFSMVEGAVLYSSFAFLKHFQSQGKNKLKAMVSGISFSARDENLHSEGGAWTFRQDLHEQKTAGLITLEQERDLYERIYAAAAKLREHEHLICDMVFEKGRIEGITAHQMKNFVDSRIDLCLENLGLSAVYKPASNPIGEWFYLGLSKAKIHDFFAGQGNNYRRDWSEEAFDWNWKKEEA